MNNKIIITPLSNIKETNIVAGEIVSLTIIDQNLIYQMSVIASNKIRNCTETVNSLSNAFRHYSKFHLSAYSKRMTPKCHMRSLNKKTLTLKEWKKFKK